MCTSEKKDYGSLRPGFDPKDAGFFWDDATLDADGTQRATRAAGQEEEVAMRIRTAERGQRCQTSPN